MTPGWNRAVGYILWLAAAAWPFDLLNYVPGLGMSLLAFLALILLPLLVLDALGQQKLRVPFEVLGPAAAILALTGLDLALHGAGDHTGEIFSGLLLFVAVVHFAPSSDTIRRYAVVSMFSGFAVTLWTLFSRLLHLTPTAFSERSGVTFSFASSVPAGVHLLLLFAVVSVSVARERRNSPVERAAATGALVFIACALGGSAILWSLGTRSIPVVAYPTLNRFGIVAAVVTLWLLVRILAKVAVSAGRQREPLHDCWLSAGFVTILACAAVPVPPGAYQGFLAALACASVLPGRLALRPARAALALYAIPIALAALNLAIVFPGNLRDQRQYDTASRRDFGAGRFARLLSRLDTIEHHAPAEVRSHLWRARTALALGEANWASFEFARAVQPPSGRLLLAPPTNSERQDFVVQMRDAVATMTGLDSVCAFERTLIAHGDRDSALYSLRLETAVPLTHIESADAAPYAETVAHILGDDAIARDLGFWSAQELVTLLMSWGAHVDESAAAAETEPFVLSAQRDAEGLSVFVYRRGHFETMHRNLAPPRAETVDALAEGWLRWSEDAVKSNAYSLTLTSHSGEQNVGRLELHDHGPAAFTLSDSPPDIPFTPAIYLRVAR